MNKKKFRSFLSEAIVMILASLGAGIAVQQGSYLAAIIWVAGQVLCLFLWHAPWENSRPDPSQHPAA